MGIDNSFNNPKLLQEQTLKRESEAATPSAEKKGKDSVECRTAQEMIKSNAHPDALILELLKINNSAFDVAEQPDLTTAREKYHSLEDIITASHGNNLVGYVWFDVLGDKADIHELVIRKDVQGRGIGALLMDKMIDELKKRGVKIAELVSTTASDHTHPSKPFYDKYFVRRKEKTGLSWTQDGPDRKRFVLRLDSES